MNGGGDTYLSFNPHFLSFPGGETFGPSVSPSVEWGKWWFLCVVVMRVK